MVSANDGDLLDHRFAHEQFGPAIGTEAADGAAIGVKERAVGSEVR